MKKQKRQRNKEKNLPKWPAVLNSALVISFISTVGVVAIAHDKPTYSELERRDLARMPKLTAQSYFSGSYTRDISAFVADVFPFRDKLLELASSVKECNGFRFDDIKLHSVNVQENQNMTSGENSKDGISSNTENGSSQKEEPGKNETSSKENNPEVSKPSDNEGQATASNGIYVYKGKAFSMYGGSKAMGDYYANAVNYYQKVFGDKVKIYNLIVPSAIEYGGLPEKYKKMSMPQKPSIEYVYSKLDPAVTPVRIYDTLMEHKDEYLFFNTDHHWTSLGAYYAYTEFAKAAGFTPVDINTLPKKTLNNFIGTLYGQTNDKSLLENPDHVDYYTMNYPVECYRYQKGAPYYPQPEPLYGEYALPANSYSVFLHGDFPLTKIVTGNKNGRKIAVIKESYGNAFAPFLINDYEEIYVVDERYFETDLISLVNENEIDEILIINNIAAAHTAFHIDNIVRIVDQPYIPPAPPPAESSESQVSEEVSEEMEIPVQAETDDEDDD